MDQAKDPMWDDFRLFVRALWLHLLNAEPSPLVLDMAWWFQHGPKEGPKDRTVTMALRGAAKSWLAGAYALWRLMKNKQEKVLIVSGAASKATEAAQWCLMLILTWDLLAELRPRAEQRQSNRSFDVNGAVPTQAPSFKAMGITGQIVGSRATLIIPDDVETQQNSLTPVMRDQIKEAVKEFDSVLVPEPGSEIKYLGTPHDEDSLYNELMDRRGYVGRVWPAQYPDAERIKHYNGRLAPWVQRAVEKDPSLVGKSTMPTRFTEENLEKRRLSMGKSEYDLQFMLDTSSAGKDKYPLKLKDLMVYPLDRRTGYDMVAWTNVPEARLRELPNRGFEGDFFHRAEIPASAERQRYNRIVMAIDPSGRGSDETAAVILGEVSAVLYVLCLYATRDGYSPKTLSRLAELCVEYEVMEVYPEDNFGDGTFTALLQPYLIAAWAKVKQPDRGTHVEGVKVTNQMSKERRVLAILEPAVQQHRLVMGEDVIRYDDDSVKRMDDTDEREAPRYSLIHQFTRLTRVKDSLVHDDRLDALAGAVAQFGSMLGLDPSIMAKQGARDRWDEEEAKIFGHDAIEDELGILGGGVPHESRPEFFRRSTR